MYIDIDIYISTSLYSAGPSLFREKMAGMSWGFGKVELKI